MAASEGAHLVEEVVAEAGNSWYKAEGKRGNMQTILPSPLRKYSWLWAIRSKWRPSDQIKEVEAERELLEKSLLGLEGEDWKYWVVWVAKDGTIGIHETMDYHPKTSSSLLHFVQSAMHSDHLNIRNAERKLIHIVGMKIYEMGESIEHGPVKVWIAPPTQTLAEICKEKESGFYMALIDNE